MTTTSKVLLIVGGVIVVGIGALVYTGYRWWQTSGRTYMVAMKDAGNEGSTFARTADNAGCVDAGLARYPRDSSTVSGMLQGSAFLSTCLRASKPTPGFCDDVPPRGQRAEMDAWARKKCEVVDGKQTICRGMLGAVQAFCRPRSADSI